MLKSTIAVVAAAALALPAVAAPRKTPEQQLTELTRGAVAGKPVSCLPFGPTLDSGRINGLALTYRYGRTLYVNRFTDACPQLDSSVVPVIVSHEGRQCRGDFARMVDQSDHLPRGVCVLGDFTPYQLPRK